jgi:hypothetical protein
MNSLRAKISKLAEELTAGIFAALKNASLEEIVAITGGPKSKIAKLAEGSSRASKGLRLERRSDDEIAQVADRIVALLEKHPHGLRAEVIREKLGLIAKELPRPIADAVAQKRIASEGNKRATTYFVRPARNNARNKKKRGVRSK